MRLFVKSLAKFGFITCIGALIMLPLGVRAHVESEAVNVATDTTGNTFFADSTIAKIGIKIAKKDIEALRLKGRASVRADIWYNGRWYSDVGLHLKGSTGSFRSIADKPCFTLNFGKFGAIEQPFGSSKIHLNNSVEDPSYACETIGADIFNSAGIPAARVRLAVVTLNEKRLGLYVIKEGLTEEYLTAHYQNSGGALYEPQHGGDVDQQLLYRAGRKGDGGEHNRQALAESDGNINDSRNGVTKAVDLDQFLTFMAIEVMIGHRDGYAMAKNNFRIYCEPKGLKYQFIPYGMDQLFGNVDTPWDPSFSGLIARAVANNPETHDAYRERFAFVLKNFFNVKTLTNRISELVLQVRPVLTSTEYKDVEGEYRHLCERIIARYAYLKDLDFTGRTPSHLNFHSGVANLGRWKAFDSGSADLMDESKSDKDLPSLHTVASQQTSSSWRTKVHLSRGRYRFQGMAKLSRVQPLTYGHNQGAGLRCGGASSTPFKFLGDSGWKMLTADFAVESDSEEIELICDFRAQAGEVWFDLNSLILRQI